jgi:hypothetical protein
MVAFDGQTVYRQAQRLLITADSGGSNGSRVRLWKLEWTGAKAQADLCCN